MKELYKDEEYIEVRVAWKDASLKNVAVRLTLWAS